MVPTCPSVPASARTIMNTAEAKTSKPMMPRGPCQTSILTIRLMESDPRVTMMMPSEKRDLARVRVPERREVVAIDQVDPDEDEDREAGEDPARHPALRGERAREPP